MALTRDFKETIQAAWSAIRPSARNSSRKGSNACSPAVDTGKAVPRDYINATIGFEALGSLTDKSPENLMRMFGHKGNPKARNLFAIIGYPQQREGLQFEVRAVR